MQESWREGGGRRRGWEVGGRWGGGGGGEGGREERGGGYSYESWRIRMNHGDFPWGEFHFVTAYGRVFVFRRDGRGTCANGGHKRKTSYVGVINGGRGRARLFMGTFRGLQ